jgi:hypothetical protein
VGETTRYVVNKAPCRVILTAPPAVGPADQRPEATERFAPPPAGDPMAPSAEPPPAVSQGAGSGDDGAAAGR